MTQPTMKRVTVVKDLDALAAEAARRVGDASRGAVLARGRFVIALAGGSTPRRLYERLGRPASPEETVDPATLLAVVGDERVVPVDDPQSNQRMAREAWFEPAGVPEASIVTLPTDASDAEAIARDYEARLRAALGAESGVVPALDVALLGMGDDGHTASLFPGDAALSETTRLVAPARAPVPPHERVTLTPPVWAAARHVLFLVSGEAKADALARVLEGEHDAARDLPAARVDRAASDAQWIVDEAAASGLRTR